MRIKLLLSIFLLLSTSLIYSQVNQNWKWSHETPQGNSLRYVKMIDANNWYAAGWYGTFMKTTNAGATWTVSHKASWPGLTNAAYGNINDGHFFDQNNGILVGSYGMVKTTNGGVTWDTIPSSFIGTGTWWQVWFRDANVGYAAGTSTGRIAKTTDGGTTWTLNTVIPSATYYDVWSPDDQLIIAATSTSSVQRSTDGGLTWTLVTTGGTQSNYKMTFASDNLTGYIAGSAGIVRKTTDAGLTWALSNTGLPTTYAFYDFDIVSSNVYVTGYAFNIFKSTDAGTTWDTVATLAPVGQPWTSQWYATDFNGTDFITVGAFGLINSRFGQIIKTHTQFKKPGTIYDVWVNPVTNTIITVGAPSSTSAFDQIMVSTNAGLTWGFGTTTVSPKQTVAMEVPEVTDKELSKDDFELMVPSSNSTFNSICMINNTTGYAVGSLSAVYKTTNGGMTWDSLTTTITAGQTLAKVDFISATTGWIFGKTANTAGTIWKTTDGGTTWTQSILTGTTSSAGQIYGSHMVNENLGWVVNYTPKPYMTTDGGTTWTAQTLSDGFGGFLYDIKMLDTNNGWCVGSSGKLYKTTNAGTNWDVQVTGTTQSLYSIKFVTANKAIIVGASGVTLITLNGGATWTIQNASGGGVTFYNAWAVAGANDSLYAIGVGASGLIMTYGVYTVPVELTSLTASVVKDAVTLNWATSTETNNKGFSIERKSSTGSFIEVAFINGKGTTTEQQRYTFTEKLQNGRYTYRLRQVDFNGNSDLSKEVEVVIGAPEAYSLAQNYPNPFNPSTTIKYAIPFDGMVNIAIYNTLGEKVATVLNQQILAGNYEVSFDASKLSTGVYFYRLESGSFVSVKKMMLLK